MVLKNTLLILFLVVLNFLHAGCTTKEVQTEPIIDTTGKDKNWQLTFSDEFDGTGAPDATKWDAPNYNRRNNNNGPDGWWSKDDSYLENGNLVIRVRAIPNKNTDTDSTDYSCGALLSKGKFEQKYGKYEIRCQLPKKQGWWVAFWMMQGNVNSVLNAGVDGSEVDVFEGFGWGDKINQAIHWDGYGAEHKKVSKALNNPKLTEGFHTYTLEWYPEVYKFFIDGVETWSTTGGGVCDQPGHLLITGEISTDPWLSGVNWAKEPSPKLYPDYFLVDWVRVYTSK